MNDKILSESVLFQGCSADEIREMLDCLGARTVMYAKGSIIYHAGDCIRQIGLVLSGSVNIENDDVWGNKTILDNIGPGQVFAETYACVPEEPMMVNAAAADSSEVLFLNMERLLKTCPNACRRHGILIQNLLSVTAQKNLNLSRKIFHTASKSIRGRLLSYLSYQSVRHGCREFTIPFNRQQLADYLCVDRSALSNELSKMQRDGLLSCSKNKFILYSQC